MSGIAILDDNQIHRENTTRIITEFFKQKGLDIDLFVFSHSSDLISALKTDSAIDIVLLDIDLGENELGIDVAKQMNRFAASVEIVFLTNYLHYATDIFETKHCYFVLKDEFEDRIADVFSKLQTTLQDNKLCVKQKTSQVFLEQKKIFYIERELRVSIIHYGNEDIRVNDKLSELVPHLNQDMFIRCHNSYIINYNSVKEYRRQEILLDQGITIPISRTYHDEVKRRFMEWARKQL